MAVINIMSEDGELFTIRIKKRFDIGLLSDFEQVRKQSKEKVVDCVVDMTGVESISSAGLGMLLVLKEYAGEVNADMQIINCSAMVKKTIMRACLSDLLNVDLG